MRIKDARTMTIYLFSKRIHQGIHPADSKEDRVPLRGGVNLQITCSIRNFFPEPIQEPGELRVGPARGVVKEEDLLHPVGK